MTTTEPVRPLVLCPGRGLHPVSVVPRRTFVSYYGEQLVWAEVHQSRELALAHRDRERDWIRWRIQGDLEYHRPTRPHLLLWRFDVI